MILLRTLGAGWSHKILPAWWVDVVGKLAEAYLIDGLVRGLVQLFHPSRTFAFAIRHGRFITPKSATFDMRPL